MVELSKQALKTLKKLQPRISKRLLASISELPSAGDIKPIKGLKTPPLYRLRVGKYRIIFQIIDENVRIIKIDTRGDIYKKM